MTIYLADITAVVDSAGTKRVLRFATHAFTSTRADTPADTVWLPYIKDPGNIEQSLYGRSQTSGNSTVGFGVLELLNMDGSLDTLMTYGFDGQPLVIRAVEDGAALSTAVTLLSVTMEQAEFSATAVTIRVRDLQAVLDVPLCRQTYAGSNVLPDGLEGSATDIKGQPKPRLYGCAFNISPPSVNTARLIYQVNDGPVAEVSAVYDKGAALTKGADYTSYADLMATAPAAGQYRVWPAGGVFRLGAAPAGTITADAWALAVGLNKNPFFLEGFQGWAGAGTSFELATVQGPVGQRAIQNVAGRTGWVLSGPVAEFLPDRQYRLEGWFRTAVAGTTGVAYLALLLYDANGAAVMASNAWGGGSGSYPLYPYSAAIPEAEWRYQRGVVGAGTTYPKPAAAKYIGVGVSLNYGSGNRVMQAQGLRVLEVIQPAQYNAAKCLHAIAADVWPGGPVNSADVNALSGMSAAEVGLWLNGQDTALQAMDRIAPSAGAWYGFDAAGTLRMGQMTVPAATPVLTLTSIEIISLEKQANRDTANGLPARAVKVNYARMHTVQTSDLAGAVAADRRATLASEYRSVTADSPAVATMHPLSSAIERTTLLNKQAEAQAEANRLIALYGTERMTFRVEARLTPAQQAALSVGATVKITHPRFGLAAGKNMVVIGVVRELESNVAHLTLWG